MAKRSNRKTGTKSRASARKTARKSAKRKTRRTAAGGRGRAGAQVTTPTPMDAIAPIGGTPPTIDGA